MWRILVQKLRRRKKRPVVEVLGMENVVGGLVLIQAELRMMRQLLRLIDKNLSRLVAPPPVRWLSYIQYDERFAMGKHWLIYRVNWDPVPATQKDVVKRVLKITSDGVSQLKEYPPETTFVDGIELLKDSTCQLSITQVDGDGNASEPVASPIFVVHDKVAPPSVTGFGLNQYSERFEEDPAPEEPAPEEPAPEEPAPENPAPENPAPEEPAQPAPENPAPEEPAPEQPPSGDGQPPVQSTTPPDELVD